MEKVTNSLDWLFKDLTTRKGKYVIAEPPNKQLLVFMIFIVLAVVTYPGFFQSMFAVIAYIAFVWWGIKETRIGRSRFRKLLGYMSIVAVLGAVWLRLGL